MPRDGAGGARGVPELAADRPEGTYVGATRPDRIELEKSLRRWTDLSWFLDEAEFRATRRRTAGPGRCPRRGASATGRTSSRCTTTPARIASRRSSSEQKLLAEVRRTRSLVQGAAAAGARVHTRPERPRESRTTAISISPFWGRKPCPTPAGRVPGAPLHRRDDRAGPPPHPPQRHRSRGPPSRDGLDAARARIREYLGWEEVRSQVGDQAQDAVREGMLAAWTEQARKRIPEASGHRAAARGHATSPAHPP